MRIAEEIKARVSVPDALDFYNVGTGRHNRIPCPIHRGADANFAYTDKVYHCWTCGAKGDVITLVCELFGLKFSQAVMKLNSDFMLGLSVKKPTHKDRQVMQENRMIDEAIEKEKQRNRAIYSAVSTLHRELFERSCKGQSDAESDALMRKAELWLDQNIEKVVVPWN